MWWEWPNFKDWAADFSRLLAATLKVIAGLWKVLDGFVILGYPLLIKIITHLIIILMAHHPGPKWLLIKVDNFTNFHNWKYNYNYTHKKHIQNESLLWQNKHVFSLEGPEIALQTHSRSKEKYRFQIDRAHGNLMRKTQPQEINTEK